MDRAALERLYLALMPVVDALPTGIYNEALRRVARSLAVLVARTLGQPCPIETRQERRLIRIDNSDRI